MRNDTITSPRGFLAAGISCGIKKSGSKDLGLIVCPAGAKAAAVFTTNRIVSAAVSVCRKHVASRGIFAVVVNSGNANTCTGQQGINNTIRMCSETARGIEAEPHMVLVASTGIIGRSL
ncbi:MAG: bifunctional ornithine acetyltransferase/N-acetylglutamate synthase, partial [Planctomycetota bacterium]